MTSADKDKATHHRYGVLVASAVVVVAGTLGLIGLADAATESDGLAAFDPELTTEAVSHRTPVLTAVARGLTFIGNPPVLVTLTVVTALILWRSERWPNSEASRFIASPRSPPGPAGGVAN